MISGHERAPLSGTARQLVVILHGWGADGANLIDLADAWAPLLPDAHFCAPNAHEVCEVNPFGFQWFSLADRSPAALMAGVSCAAREVNAFIDAKLQQLSANASEGIKISLVGFSQGTMTTLHVALRRPDISCVLGYSGALLEDEGSIAKLASSRRAPEAIKITLIHGEEDDVVPYSSLARAEKLLKSAKLDVTTHSRPRLGHSIDMPGLKIGGEFLVACLGA